MRKVLSTIPALAVLTAAIGCGDGAKPGNNTPSYTFLATAPQTGGAQTKPDAPPPTGGVTPPATGGATKPPPAGGAKTPVEAKGTAILKGTVTVDGSPMPDDISAQVNGQGDKAVCLKDDPANPDPAKGRNWVVKDGKVANVVVFVRPPAGKYFAFSADDVKSWEGKEVKVDQPFCHFEPHVAVAFPQYFDGKKMQPTKQVTKVFNSAPISHNTKWGGDERKNPGGNPTLPPGDSKVLDIQADVTKPIRLNCNIHQWMEGYIWPLDTPYAAVTKPDGTYEIKGVPAGAEVVVVTWHEKSGWGEGGPQGKKITLKEGENVHDFKVTAK